MTIQQMLKIYNGYAKERHTCICINVCIKPMYKCVQNSIKFSNYKRGFAC